MRAVDSTLIRDSLSRVRPNQMLFNFGETPNGAQELPVSKVFLRPELEALAGRTSQLEIVNLGERKGNQVYPFVNSSPELNAELRKIEELKLGQDQSKAIEILERSVLAKVFPGLDKDNAAADLAKSTIFLKTFNPERDFDLVTYLSPSYSEFSVKQPRKYEHVIEEFNSGNLLQDILKAEGSSSDIYRMLVNLTNHLIQSQAAAEYERMSQELDAAPNAYSDGKSSAVK